MADRIQIRGGDPDRVVAGNTRYDLLYDNDQGQRVALQAFESTEDMLTFMNLKDEQGRSRYEYDAAFRETIKDIAANSPALFSEPTLARKSPIPTNKEFLESLRIDALRERREQLVDIAGGKNAQAKYDLALAMTNPEFAESAYEMEGHTEQARPMEQYLKERKAQGLPTKWESQDAAEVEDADAQREKAHNDAILAEMGDADITLGDK